MTRLQDAGAIVIGKTTTSEFGWKGVSQSPLTGITHNPWKHGYNAGASSAGAGAAAAAGFGPLHQGSDGAGSIRMPSHFCGVFGLKPSFGRVPAYPVSTGDYTSHSGPMSRSVADAALMLEVMAGPHPLDHTTLEAWPANYTGRLHAGVKGRRIAYSPDLGHARVDPEVAALVKAAAARFTELGATVEQVATPWAEEGPELVRFFWPAHMTRLAPKLKDWASKMDPGLVACIEAGMNISVVDYLLMRERKMAYVVGDQSLVRGLGLPADARGLGRRLPGRSADAGRLAVPSVGLGELGRVLLSVQHVVEPRGQRALRLHRGRAAGRAAGGRPAVRRPGRAAGGGGVRGGAALGRQASRAGLSPGVLSLRHSPIVTRGGRRAPAMRPGR